MCERTTTQHNEPSLQLQPSLQPLPVYVNQQMPISVHVCTYTQARMSVHMYTHMNPVYEYERKCQKEMHTYVCVRT